MGGGGSEAGAGRTPWLKSAVMGGSTHPHEGGWAQHHMILETALLELLNLVMAKNGNFYFFKKEANPSICHVMAAKPSEFFFFD